MMKNHFKNYFNSEELKTKKCISNDRDNKNVYMEEIEEKVYYVKKNLISKRNKIRIMKINRHIIFSVIYLLYTKKIKGSIDYRVTQSLLRYHITF